jgi:hypothetical protein
VDAFFTDLARRTLAVEPESSLDRANLSRIVLRAIGT